VHSAKDKMANAILKDGMIGRAKNQTPKPRLV
jgi:hypothetical protein